MTTAQFDLQKIEKLLASATSERERKMYSGLLKKAEKQQQELQQSQKVASPAPKKQQSQKVAALNSKRTREPNTAIFQAIGNIIVTPKLVDDRIEITFSNRTFELRPPAMYNPSAYRLFKTKIEQNPGCSSLLRVYPNCRFPDRNTHNLFFCLNNFQIQPEEQVPPTFKLRGVFQWIPQYKFPIITIYRNGDRSEVFNKLKPKQKPYFAKAQHIPLIWKNAPIKPFSFNPKVKEQMPRYFVEVEASFTGKIFVFKKLLSEPTTNIPRYIKFKRD